MELAVQPLLFRWRKTSLLDDLLLVLRLINHAEAYIEDDLLGHVFLLSGR